MRILYLGFSGLNLFVSTQKFHEVKEPLISLGSSGKSTIDNAGEKHALFQLCLNA